MLPPILVEFRRLYPGIEIKVLTGSMTELQDALGKGQVDMLFLPAYSPEATGEFRTEVLFREELLVGNRSMLTPDWV